VCTAQAVVRRVRGGGGVVVLVLLRLFRGLCLKFL
jgi:hypothetical protein